MRKKVDGLLLREKIPKLLKKAKKHGYVELLDEDFFKEEIENGCIF